MIQRFVIGAHQEPKYSREQNPNPVAHTTTIPPAASGHPLTTKTLETSDARTRRTDPEKIILRESEEFPVVLGLDERSQYYEI